jgi:hypothetical protein
MKPDLDPTKKGQIKPDPDQRGWLIVSLLG